MTTHPDLLLAELSEKIFKPKTRLNTHEWARQHVRLDERFTARPGFYDVNFTPYMRGPHEWFSDPYVKEITGCASRQVGKTTFLANSMMYAVGEDPGPCLYVTSTRDNAQSFSEREWIPRIEASPLMQELKPDDEDDFKRTEQHFKTCTVRFVGSNSSSNLMSRPIRYLFEDEIDTWPVDREDEAPAIETVEACTLSYAHIRKILRVSTPTVPTGSVWMYFLRGTMHKYFVPCAHCRNHFELLFEQLNFHRDECRDSKTGVWNLDKVEALATLRCPNCKKDIEQVEQSVMVLEGVWRQTNPTAPRDHISWHISALYSPNITWGHLAKTFLQKCHTSGGLHDFYNHYLGLPWTRKSTAITITDVERVRDSSPEYVTYSGPEWVAPANFKLVLMAVDVQQDGFWFAHRGITLEEASFLIDYGPAVAWDDLLHLFERVYTLPNGEKLPLYKALIDSGFVARRISGVYDFCLRSGGRFVPCQGRSPVHGLYQPIRETQFEHRGVLFNAVQLRDDMFKEELYIRRIKERAGAPWYLPRNISETYKRQVTNERLVSRKDAVGREVMDWVDEGNNHLGDVEKYLLAAQALVAPFLKAEREGRLEKAEDEKEEIEKLVEGVDVLQLNPDFQDLPRTPQESARRRAAMSLELPAG